MKKTNNQEGVFAIIAALIVLFSTMLNPLISAAISFIALVIFVIWEFNKK
ncbi:MAG: hypothetical protein WCX73_04275 [Candidatus Pacearchaeota archaeon]